MNKQTLALIILVLLWLFFLIVIIQHESLQVSENSVYLNYLSRSKTTLKSKEPWFALLTSMKFQRHMWHPRVFFWLLFTSSLSMSHHWFYLAYQLLTLKILWTSRKKTQNIFFILLKSLKFIQVLLIASDSIITEQQQKKKQTEKIKLVLF